MHSSFTFNPNAHRAPSNYQQQSGHSQPVYNIGAPLSGFMSHPNHFMSHHAFTRSFASVVSCENNLGNRQNMGNVNKTNNCHSNNNAGILNTFMKHFSKPTLPQYQTVTPQNKEFEDFTHMPSLPAHNYINTPHHPPPHFQQQPQSNHINVKVPIISGQFYSQSAQVPTVNNINSTSTTRTFMASLFGGYHQQPRQQKPRRWFGKGFRCGRGGGGGNRWKNPKFHDQDVNLQKSIHEKERTSIERDIHDDSCDFVHVDDKDVMNHVECDKKQSSANNPNETAKGSCDDPPFMIYSLEEFPAIVSIPVVPTPKSPSPAKSIEKESCEEDFVVLPTEASISTPTFIPRRLTLCEKVEKIIKSSPTRINGYLKPCLKKSRRRYSECSDDFDVVFSSGADDHEPPEDFCFSDGDSETDSDDDDDDVAHEMAEIAEEDDDESSDEEDEDEVDTAEQQLDSGVEEKRVSYTNLDQQMEIY